MHRNSNRAQDTRFHQPPHDGCCRASTFQDRSRFRKACAMQYLLEQVGSEQRLINKASPLRARKSPFVRSRNSAQVLRDNLCPPGDHILLILHAKFREAVSIPRHHTVQCKLLRRQKMTEVFLTGFNQSLLRGVCEPREPCGYCRFVLRPFRQTLHRSVPLRVLLERIMFSLNHLETGLILPPPDSYADWIA
jgi:hypothetical protein